MHPDDEREYMDEISGMTRWDDMHERYAGELDGLDDDGYECENKVTLWAKLTRRISWWCYKARLWWDSRKEDDIPF